MKKLLLVFMSLAMGCSAICQSWIRIYGDSSNHTRAYRIVEHYDNGYLFSGHKFQIGSYDLGWTMKTDINGYTLWTKTFMDVSSISPMGGIDNTDNGGFIVLGQMNKYGHSVAYVVKMNACGEKEWCRLYRTPGRDVYGLDIQSMPGGGSVIMLGNWGTDWSKDLWLLRLDDNGDIVWQQAYGLSPLFYTPEGNQLYRTHDTTFVITGIVYSPDSGQTNPYKRRPMIIRVTPDGNALFELAWGTAQNFKGSGWASCEDKKGNLLSVGQSELINQSYMGPCLVRTSKTGQPLQYHNLVDTSEIGGASTINWFADSTLVIGIGWKKIAVPGEPFVIGAIKTDSLGNKIKFKQLIYDGDQAFNDAVMTFDNKVVLINSYYQTGSVKTFAFKLNSNLDYDSVYTHPYTYDSLCPHPVVSDTMPLDDCHIVHVGLDDVEADPSSVKLKIFPNPALDRVTIEMPRYLLRKSTQAGVTITTVYHQWNNATLEIYDLPGKRMFSREVSDNTGRITIDVSAWNTGIYIARLLLHSDLVAGVKFIVGD